MARMNAPAATGVLALSLLLCLSAFAEERPYVSALRSLSVNRSLLTKSVAEYEALAKEAEDSPSGELSKKLEDLRYKILALKEDAQRLQNTMPDPKKADEFLAEMVERQKALGAADRAERALNQKAVDDTLAKIYALHERALGFVSKQMFSQAADLYDEILLLSPDDDEAYLLLGHTRLAAGEYAKAAQAFGNAVHIDPANEKEITRLYENILVENPSDDDAMAQLGFAQLMLGKAEEARRSFEGALQLNAANAAAQRGLMELQASPR